MLTAIRRAAVLNPLPRLSPNQRENLQQWFSRNAECCRPDADLHVVLRRRRRGFRGEDASGRQLRTRINVRWMLLFKCVNPEWLVRDFLSPRRC